MNKNLVNARRNKNDEFYTLYKDVEAEVEHYIDQITGKHVYLNCDNPKYSQFWQYFYDNYTRLSLKRLTATYYTEEGKAERFDVTRAPDGPQITTRRPIPGNGSYNSPEAIEILKEADIVITNPPFSLFRDYIDTLVTYQKDFLIIGTINTFTYKNVFLSIQNNEIRTGYNHGSMTFKVPNRPEYADKSSFFIEDGQAYTKLGNICWYTTLSVYSRPPLELTKTYTPAAYPRYDNYDAIEVSRVKDIPIDYAGVMGVPITYLEKHDPSRFTLLGMTDRDNPHGIKTKIYTNGKQYRLDGTTNSSEINDRATLPIDDSHTGTYYTADNADYKLKKLYARLLIQPVTPEDGNYNDMNAGPVLNVDGKLVCKYMRLLIQRNEEK